MLVRLEPSRATQSAFSPIRHSAQFRVLLNRALLSRPQSQNRSNIGDPGPFASKIASDILRVDENKVVDDNGNKAILRGAAIGGWLKYYALSTTSHNPFLQLTKTHQHGKFIAGCPVRKSQHRAAMQKVGRPEKYELFFASGEMNPCVLKEGGFKHLARVVELCAKENIYTILDMHTTPGGQNPGWHSDNPTHYAAFWMYKDHQDRTVWLWEQITARYKGNTWVAGYNTLNEPYDSEHIRLPAFYERLEKAIGAVDPDHILWLDGNTFAMGWRGFDRVLPNCVYAMHDYASMGFPTDPRYKGAPGQKSYLERQFLRKTVQNPLSIWLYKDIGLQGMIHTNLDSPGNKLIQPFLNKKKILMLDHWGRDPDAAVDAVGVLKPLVEWIHRVSPSAKETYPTPLYTERLLLRGVFQTFLANSFADDFAGLLQGLDKSALEELARSFAFEVCVQREGF
ncbi:glycoside hydrolase superfamily [Aspergillus similis]